MSADTLDQTEKTYLLQLARRSIEAAVNRQPLPRIVLEELPPVLREDGASFVTLTERGELRGCIGALEPYQPLALDVQEHAVAAAMDDYRFPPVSSQEIGILHIEISRLTLPQPLIYQGPADLLDKLRPHIDGVILRDGVRRATFLPQVWEKIPDPAIFLTQLCLKMGAPANLWRQRALMVYTYQVQEFHE